MVAANKSAAPLGESAEDVSLGVGCACNDGCGRVVVNECGDR